ncbi:MAG: STAS-like domain-containing protein [Patescibacteria group bacterium]
MIIDIKKFGAILTSRQLGKEAFMAFSPNFNNISEEEKIYINFDDIDVFSPSWGDEFLTALYRKFGDHLILKKSSNASVNASVEMLEEANNIKFNIE